MPDPDGSGGGVSGAIEASEPLVVMIVTGQGQVDAPVDCGLPQRLDYALWIMGARGPARMVHGHRGAVLWVLLQVAGQPVRLFGAGDLTRIRR